jgi:hypothetical protein
VRALWETVEGFALVFGGIALTALPFVALWLFVDEGDAVWGIVLVAGVAVWIVGGIAVAIWDRLT